MSDPPVDARARHVLARGRDVRALITCEHGGNEVPEEYATLFEGLNAALCSHRGWDVGALGLAEWLGTTLRAPVIASSVSRLLVDLNRSEHHPRVFSEATRPLARPDRERLLARYHRPHRAAVAEAVASLVRRRSTVLHLAIHSFTPVLDGVVRSADLGVLYDPARSGERALCVALARALSAGLPGRRVRRNYPYRGRSDGLTKTLRGLHGGEDYLGIEIEVNQKHVDAEARFPRWVGEALAGPLVAVLGRGADT